MTMFSRRSDWELQPNPLSQALAARREAGLPVLDLTLSNPTRAGLQYPPQLQAILAGADASIYAPEPLGLFSARQAVAGYYAERGQLVDAEDLILTCSTSEAYALLFKLLADPGDQVLVPQPSYPLFEFLASLENVETRSYPLRYQEGWEIDLDRLAAALTPRTRAIVLVHPNNPTGSLIKAGERVLLEELALERDLALIIDEVFGDYLWEEAPQVPSFAGPARPLTFVLSGLSKVLGLPQLKLGWMAVQGAGVAEARARLEVIADTYLSVGTPVQQALPQLLELRAVIQEKIGQRVTANRRWLQQRLAQFPHARLLRGQGGWYAVLETNRQDEEVLALALLRHSGVFLHPGYFFDFPVEGMLVLSLLTPPQVLQEGVELLLQKLA
ncbi:MAG: pyridoxal phosphate-dependent aminotransferase [Candidatus Latescibacteria bacterium]|nr:pyridoxal phosphate-dependent aminotransferase [Candidatus Latescibacterota bacterium]